uniref:PEGA domain-containing protein n=1 Tax=Gracilinema caldarium TaxID=215591 RepID=A0A7C3E7L7_9SPIR
MKLRRYAVLCLLSAILTPLPAEPFRTTLKGTIEVSPLRPEGKTLTLTYIDAVAVTLTPDSAFLKGIELEFKVPQIYLKYRSSVGMSLYNGIKDIPKPGVVDFQLDRLAFEIIPAKLQAVYQIPLRSGHGLKTSPYVTVPTGIIQPQAFPLVIRLMPLIKGLSEEVETMEFGLTIRPIVADEGALKLRIRTPETMKDKPFTVLIDDEVVPDFNKERILKTGEHHLSIISEDFRSESRTFSIERAKTQDLTVDLRDTTPVIQFEAPENTKIYLDDTLLTNIRQSVLTVPGEHTVRFQVDDYSVVKQLSIEKGKTYKIALTVDVSVNEE